MKQSELLQIFLEQQERNTKAFEGLQGALLLINEHNTLHAAKDDENYESIRKLETSNNRVVSLIQWVLTAVVSALIVLAGAEKVIPLLK